MLPACDTNSNKGKKHVEQGPLSQVFVKALDVEGEALTNVPVHVVWTGRLVKEEGPNSSQKADESVILSDNEGEVFVQRAIAPRLSGRGAIALDIEAECPPGYSGEPLKRHLSASLLRSAKRWSFNLICESVYVQLGIAVLSEGCGEVSLKLDGAPLGSTSHGVFHGLQSISRKQSAVLVATPLDEKCLLRDATRVVELNQGPGSLLARFTGEYPVTKRKKRARQLKKKKSRRPYRL